ncbi:hypothetical protein [Mastigocoleus sp. MO_188.B34]|uniref:hypothetical protein n=1 Tax=Mastigocoleus sp. MO_188.B34 TaxID=3036635 RepID=UPI002611AEF4|nr:hypothetical protein [Mastigocoleus sp. MO_188.B34]MDJ0695047.1 hypothetical protein [Mastigocoleus sp. MO_188.B34]
MKTAEKFAAGWLLMLGFIFLSLSVSAKLEKSVFEKALNRSSDQFEFGVPDDELLDAIEEKNNQVVGGLVFGLPTSILGGWLALSLYRDKRQQRNALNQKINEQLQSTFYRMVLENEGRITVLKFAMHSQLPPATAKEYLDQKAKEFNADFNVNEDGGISYYFDV